MINIEELRRLAQEATPGPWKILPVGDGRQKFAVADSEFLSILAVTDECEATFGTVYDDADARFISAANPAAISELLDSLEAAEKERDDVVQQLVLSEIGKRWISEAHNAATRRLSVLADENTALRAKIAAMGRKKPASPVPATGYSNQFPLYALPGAQAQPAPSIPEAVMEVIAGLVYEVERNICPHEETHRGGQWEICDMCGARWADDRGGKPAFKWPEVVERAWAMLAAAPEAKPCP